MIPMYLSTPLFSTSMGEGGGAGGGVDGGGDGGGDTIIKTVPQLLLVSRLLKENLLKTKMRAPTPRRMSMTMMMMLIMMR